MNQILKTPCQKFHTNHLELEDQHPEVTGLFKGSKEGAWWESFVVDVLELDGQKFMGSLTRKEMSSSIYTKALGLRPENLHGFVPGYKGHPTIKYPLKEKINIDLDLQGKSVFTFERVVKKGSEVLIPSLKCEIAGIRELADISEGNGKVRKSRYTWIKVEGAEYELRGGGGDCRLATEVRKSSFRVNRRQGA